DDRVADDQRVGAADLDRRQPAGVDLDDGQVGGGVPTEDPGRELAAVGQGDGDGGGAVDDVVVRHDDAVGAEDEAAAGALLGHGRPDPGEGKSGGGRDRRLGRRKTEPRIGGTGRRRRRAGAVGGRGGRVGRQGRRTVGRGRGRDRRTPGEARPPVAGTGGLRGPYRRGRVGHWVSSCRTGALPRRCP